VVWAAQDSHDITLQTLIFTAMTLAVLRDHFSTRNALPDNHPNSKSASGQMVVFIMAMKLNEGISMKLAWTLVIKQKSAWHMPHRMPEAFER